MINEKKIEARLSQMEAAAQLILSEAKQIRSILQKETKPKSAFELDVKRKMAARKARVLSKLNKKSLP